MWILCILLQQRDLELDGAYNSFLITPAPSLTTIDYRVSANVTGNPRVLRRILLTSPIMQISKNNGAHSVQIPRGEAKIISS